MLRGFNSFVAPCLWFVL